MRVSGLVIAIVALFGVSASAEAKGFGRLVVIGSDGRSVEVHAEERVIDGALSHRGELAPARGGYLRLFFVGPGDFPANPARYYPEALCVALDWPRYETFCRRVHPATARLLLKSRTLQRFHVRPTVLARIASGGARAPDPLRDPIELALDRIGRPTVRPGSCAELAGTWRGPAAAMRPRRFWLCPTGVYAAGRLHPLREGVLDWFRGSP
jgi:hypothetical protein